LAAVVFHVLQTAYFLTSTLLTLVKFFTRPQLATIMIATVDIFTLATLGDVAQIEQILLVGHYPNLFVAIAQRFLQILVENFANVN
jgi:hypothetical protein